ncbi:MAG: monovalent cation/H(+) antiporter subunit G [Syntrophomonadaceae bacterium]|jgi:multicomponent Na+:H+ antiporter subunit G
MDVNVKILIVILLLAAGSFLMVVASIGVLRFPDVYSRMHPAGKVDTFGQTLILLGLAVYQGISPLTIKILLIILFLYVINPAATHFLAQAAYQSGLKPWQKNKND